MYTKKELFMNMKKIANSILQTKASEELEEQVKEELKIEDGNQSIASLLAQHETTEEHDGKGSSRDD